MPKRDTAAERGDLLMPSEIEDLRKKFKDSYRRMRELREKQILQNLNVPQDRDDPNKGE